MNEWLRQFVSTVKKDKKRSLLILILTGVLILVIAWPVSEGGDMDEAGADRTEEDSLGGKSPAQENTGGEGLKDASGALSEGQTLEAYVSQAQEQLTELLSSIEGAGPVRVMITARATREKVVGKDVSTSVSTVEESDGSGGTRVTGETGYSESALYAGEGSGSEDGAPYVVKELVPEIEGVVVAARGADDEYVVDEITQAVSVLFNLPVHKIKVVKMEA